MNALVGGCESKRKMRCDFVDSLDMSEIRNQTGEFSSPVDTIPNFPTYILSCAMSLYSRGHLPVQKWNFGLRPVLMRNRRRSFDTRGRRQSPFVRHGATDPRLLRPTIKRHRWHQGASCGRSGPPEPPPTSSNASSLVKLFLDLPSSGLSCPCFTDNIPVCNLEAGEQPTVYVCPPRVLAA